MDTKELAKVAQVVREHGMIAAPGLGVRVRDTVSGFEGIVEARTEWLNGCVRCTVAPDNLDDKGNLRDSKCFDWEQLFVVPDRARLPVKPAERQTNGPMPSPERR